jgi:hypothetical protein
MGQRKIAKEDEVIIELISSMKNAPNDIIIQEACNALLENIFSGEELKVNKDLFLMEDGVIGVVMDALRDLENATNLQVIGISLLDKIGQVDDDFAAAMTKHPAWLTIIRVAYKNSVDNPELRRATASLLEMLDTHFVNKNGPAAASQRSPSK